VRVILKDGLLILSVEDAAEAAAFAAWREATRDHVFHFDGGSEKGGALRDLGLRADACREPINIVHGIGEPRWQPIGNLAHTPFVLRGRGYASVEGFWQGLKFSAEADRSRIAQLWGNAAKAAGYAAPKMDQFDYDGRTYGTGSADHRALMLLACRAKFAQNLVAREALLATGDRPLTHRVRRDSRTIPGAVMAEMWMRIRAACRMTPDASIPRE